jgi:hypothetical protein
LNAKPTSARPHPDREGPPRHAAARERLVDVVQVERARGAVDERDPVEDESRREGAEQEVLERGLDRPGPVTQEARKDVEGDREQLETHEDHEEVLAPRHGHHPGDREHQQPVVLPVAGLLALQVAGRGEDGERARSEEEQVEEDREVVGEDETAGGFGRVSAQAQDRTAATTSPMKLAAASRRLSLAREGRREDEHEQPVGGHDQDRHHDVEVVHRDLTVPAST